ncbi:MAG: GNAT family N-acetyltransferase [Nanoarchaeota archaeon]|nr:GNAT family N-acetyltransferase [Nanoarchaeota archaeon]
MKVKLQSVQESDAEIFYSILKQPEFSKSSFNFNTIQDVVNWMKSINKDQQKVYSIIYNNKTVGMSTIIINQNRKFIGEFGFFIDKNFCNKGIATNTVKNLEEIGFNQLNLIRIEIKMEITNKACERVAVKCGFKKEGIMKKALKIKDKYYDCYLYSKTKQNVAPF